MASTYDQIGADKSYDRDKREKENQAKVQEVIQELEHLEQSYRNDASHLPSRHIGAYVREISNIVNPFSMSKWTSNLEWEDNINVRQSILSVLNVVLDHDQFPDRTPDRTRLNDLDEANVTPLQVAVSLGAKECIEILLARGANCPDDLNAFMQGLPDAPIPEEMTKPMPRASGGLLLSAARHGHNLIVQSLWNARRDKGLFHLRNLLMVRREIRKSGKDPPQVCSVWTDGPGESPGRSRNRIRLGRMLSIGPWMPNALPRSARRTWIHAPSTNVLTLLYVCGVVEDSYNGDRRSYENVQISKQLCSSILPPFIASNNPLLNYRDSMFDLLGSKDDRETVGSAIVFPFLALERIRTVRQIRREYGRDTETPWMFDIGNGPSLGVFLERTLDQLYFPSMTADFFKSRNEDQVVSKEWRRTSGNAKSDCAPMLMVPQLWLWNFGGSLLLSACSNKRSNKAIYTGEFSDYSRLCRSYAMFVPAVQMGLIMAGRISEFGKEHDKDGKGPKFKSALHLFETAVISVLSQVQDYLDAESATYTIQQQKEKERIFLHTVSDIHSELDMITAVLEQQQEIMDKFLDHTQKRRHESTGKEAEAWGKVTGASLSIKAYINRVQKIHRDADRVEKTIESYLSLKRTYASIEDTRNGLMVGFTATAFAFVTVIFTPLSFMTSLFALPVDRFVQQQVNNPIGDGNVFRSSYMGGYTALAGIATWILTIILLIGLYYYWKSSSNANKVEKATNRDQKLADGAYANRLRKDETNTNNTHVSETNIIELNAIEAHADENSANGTSDGDLSSVDDDMPSLSDDRYVDDISDQEQTKEDGRRIGPKQVRAAKVIVACSVRCFGAIIPS